MLSAAYQPPTAAVEHLPAPSHLPPSRQSPPSFPDLLPHSCHPAAPVQPAHDARPLPPSSSQRSPVERGTGAVPPSVPPHQPPPARQQTDKSGGRLLSGGSQRPWGGEKKSRNLWKTPPPAAAAWKPKSTTANLRGDGAPAELLQPPTYESGESSSSRLISTKSALAGVFGLGSRSKGRKAGGKKPPAAPASGDTSVASPGAGGKILLARQSTDAGNTSAPAAAAGGGRFMVGRSRRETTKLQRSVSPTNLNPQSRWSNATRVQPK